MTVRMLDENGDIVTSGVQFIDGKSEISQTISTRIKLFLGENFRDIQDGTPWFQQILNKETSEQTRESILRKRIATTKGVVKLISFDTEFNLDTRTWSVNVGVLTEYGIESITLDGVS